MRTWNSSFQRRIICKNALSSLYKWSLHYNPHSLSLALHCIKCDWARQQIIKAICSLGWHFHYCFHHWDFCSRNHSVWHDCEALHVYRACVIIWMEVLFQEHQFISACVFYFIASCWLYSKLDFVSIRTAHYEVFKSFQSDLTCVHLN